MPTGEWRVKYYQSERYIAHSDYDPEAEWGNSVNDVALIQVEEPFKMVDSKTPAKRLRICFWTNRRANKYNTGTVVGLGLTNRNAG